MNDDDVILIKRLRAILKRRKGYSEKKMFGGVCFMINGNMCVGPWNGALIVRLSRDDHDSTQSEPHVKPMDITGKVMRGWAMIEPDGIATDEQLKAWVRRAAKFAASLPSK
jgi:TfoX/Sxy family transcriptional regulator of competence genes